MVEAEAPEKIAKQRAVGIAQRTGAGHGEDQNFIAVDIKYGLLLPDAFPVAQVAGMDNFTLGKIVAKRSGAALTLLPALDVFFHQDKLAIDIRGKRFAGVEGIAGDIERRRIRSGRREYVDGTILITLRKGDLSFTEKALRM